MRRNGCKTKKITYLLLVTLVMLLTACSGETDTSETKDEVTNEQNTKNVQKGDIIVITGGFPNNSVSKKTNFMKIEEIK